MTFPQWRSLAALLTAILFGLIQPASAQTGQGSANVTPRVGFSCPPAKIWDTDSIGQALCVDCRGLHPPPESRVLSCPGGLAGQINEARQFTCIANIWQPGVWQPVSNNCACPPGESWNGVACVVIGLDVCANLPGVQPAPPPGYVAVLGDCLPIPSGADSCWGPTLGTGPTIQADCWCEYGYDISNQRTWIWQSWPGIGRHFAVYFLPNWPYWSGAVWLSGLSYQGPRYDLCP